MGIASSLESVAFHAHTTKLYPQHSHVCLWSDRGSADKAICLEGVYIVSHGERYGWRAIPIWSLALMLKFCDSFDIFSLRSKGPVTPTDFPTDWKDNDI